MTETIFPDRYCGHFNHNNKNCIHNFNMCGECARDKCPFVKMGIVK